MQRALDVHARLRRHEYREKDHDQHVGHQAESRADQPESAAEDLDAAAREHAAHIRERDEPAAELAPAELFPEALDDLRDAVDECERLRQDAAAEERTAGDEYPEKHRADQ